MPWFDYLGFAAALSVVTSFCMTTIFALRLFALFSNLLFILYGALGHIYPVLCLHVILLPVNAVKLYFLQKPQVHSRDRLGSVGKAAGEAERGRRAPY